jgi:anion-transporting  ArsA/GET3 family ATPase
VNGPTTRPAHRPVQRLLDRSLLFVTGKGGTGKTTVAAAAALLAVGEGKRVLLVEMDAKGSLADALDTAPLSFEPRRVELAGQARSGGGELHLMSMNTEDSLREYLRVIAKVPLVGRIGPLARTFDFVADAAPGVKEILAVGKVCHEVRQRAYDLVIVDSEASGHVVAQLDAPRAIRGLVQVGPIRDQTEWMLEILGDQQRTGLLVVTTPEEMPVTETVELVGRVRSSTDVLVAGVVANRVLPRWFAGPDAEVFAALAAVELPQPPVVPRGLEVVVAAAAGVEARRIAGAEQLGHLRDALPGLPVTVVPELYPRAGGRRVTSLVAEHLADEWESA